MPPIWTHLASGFRPYLILIGLSLVLFVPGLDSIPPLDRDESRFAQATAQMLESGEMVDIRFQDKPRHKKPAGAYWAQAASVSLLSDVEAREIWAYRVPSVIAATLAVLFVFWGGTALIGRGPAFAGALLMATALILSSEAHQAKTDAMLLAATTLAMACLARIWTRWQDGDPSRPWIEPVLLWVGVGLGMLIKGPMTPMVVGLTVIALLVTGRDRGWFWSLRPVIGVAIAAIIFLPWAVAIFVETQGAFFGSAVGDDLLPKLVSGQESHGAPPSYYSLLVLVTFWPASLLLWPGLKSAWQDRKGDPSARFLLCWLIPSWIVFELVPTKLPHYTLPLYPALALMAGLAADQIARGMAVDRAARVVAWVWLVIGVILAAAVLIVPHVKGDGPAWWAAVLALSVLPVLWITRKAFAQGRIKRAILGCAASATLLYPAILAGTLPELDRLAIAPRLAEAVDRLSPGQRFASSGFHEPSLVFLTATDTALVPPEAAADLLADGTVALVGVIQRYRPAFEARAAEREIRLERVGVVSGLNYSKGDEIDITLFRRIGN
ncbi:MAG: glycosyltransferase family 39 protein [Alphaproteobacteria bacterium]|nr:glycosyltransferase family 39 protein [Alphaproteobacteria bacterium]